MASYLEQEIKYLKGVGPKRAELLARELGIFTFRDLLYHFPYKYIDRTKIYNIEEINTTQAYIQLKGHIVTFRTEGHPRKKRLIAVFTDGSKNINLVWFQAINWVLKSFQAEKEYIVFGKPAMFNGTLSIAHPEIEPAEKLNDELNPSFSPQYSTTEKLKNEYISSKTIQKLITTLLPVVYDKIDETLPDYLLAQQHLLPLKDALFNVHLPKNSAFLEKAIYRLKFEELFLIQMSILKQKFTRHQRFKGIMFSKVGDYLNNFYKLKLSFELTGAQKKVIKEIRRDMGSGKQMNRLLQGDVGSGKTLVALMAMLITLDNGYQACLMAPTEILANQHYQTLCRFLEGMDVKIGLLTGSTRKKERELLHGELRSGKLQILVGTHALLEETVEFASLGFVVIDEQHRFGVAQRARLWKKNETNLPHVLVMTATPIPRTLAMTLYGDLDVSVIDELPPGRKPIKTFHYFDSKRLPMFGFLRKQIEAGHQVYVVYPMIKESEKMDYKYLEDGYEAFARAFPPPEYVVTCVHGQMKNEEKDASMKLFAEGKSHILIATTVIEVGVDVPNANVMVIESAERFGLSQLHQLRGRVGRGAKQSYCLLMTSYKLSAEAKKRITTMVATNDGFEIAEADLKLRGPGDMEGTQQSGVPFDLKISNLARDGQLIQVARDLATEILSDDPELAEEKNFKLVALIGSMKKTTVDWSVIS
ncbi:MAG: ATP-dependent DNA helicase RecG [Bacteroidales bacterium]|nr:ATP-dependent DNA helicase RecG [Bacteroidales bacterium]